MYKEIVKEKVQLDKRLREFKKRILEIQNQGLIEADIKEIKETIKVTPRDVKDQTGVIFSHLSKEVEMVEWKFVPSDISRVFDLADSL